jgi:hypothetical protein
MRGTVVEKHVSNGLLVVVGRLEEGDWSTHSSSTSAPN